MNESDRIWSELENLVSRRRLPGRTIAALFDAAIGLRVRNATYRAYVEGEITEATASRDLKQLVEADLLAPKGERRGRYYVAHPELSNIRKMVISMRGKRDDSDPFADV